MSGLVLFYPTRSLITLDSKTVPCSRASAKRTRAVWGERASRNLAYKRLRDAFLFFFSRCNLVYRPLARPGECSQSGGQNKIFFYMRIDLNSQKRKFRLFCPPDWLYQSHDVQGVYIHFRGREVFPA